MVSPDLLKIELDPKDPSKEKAEILERFRDEIEALFLAEKEKSSPTGHFTDPEGKNLEFKKSDLGLDELNLWTGFKACSVGSRPVDQCLADFFNYLEKINSEPFLSLAKNGLASHIGNKLTDLSGKEEYRRRGQ